LVTDELNGAPVFGPDPIVIFTTGSPRLPWQSWAAKLLRTDSPKASNRDLLMNIFLINSNIIKKLDSFLLTTIESPG
jgi:hypothetical protein